MSHLATPPLSPCHSGSDLAMRLHGHSLARLTVENLDQAVAGLPQGTLVERPDPQHLARRSVLAWVYGQPMLLVEQSSSAEV